MVTTLTTQTSLLAALALVFVDLILHSGKLLKARRFLRTRKSHKAFQSCTSRNAGLWTSRMIWQMFGTLVSVYGSVVIQVSATGKIEIFMNNFELHSNFHQSVKKLGDRKLHHIRSARIYIDGQNSNGCWPWNFIPRFSDYSTLIGLYPVVSATVKYKNKTTYSIHCSNGLVFAMKFIYRTFE